MVWIARWFNSSSNSEWLSEGNKDDMEDNVMIKKQDDVEEDAKILWLVGLLSHLATQTPKDSWCWTYREWGPIDKNDRPGDDGTLRSV